MIHRLSPCARCGKLARPLFWLPTDDGGAVITRSGSPDTDVTFFGCGECINTVTGTLDNVRPIFDAMIARGIPRDIANDTMTHLLGRLDERAEASSKGAE